MKPASCPHCGAPANWRDWLMSLRRRLLQVSGELDLMAEIRRELAATR